MILIAPSEKVENYQILFKDDSDNVDNKIVTWMQEVEKEKIADTAHLSKARSSDKNIEGISLE